MLFFLRLLSHIFVKEFYKINAGFFLFFFLLFFGIVNPGSVLSYHKTIIDGILTAPALLLAAIFIWMLYQIKCLNAFSLLLGQQANAFLINLQCLPGSLRWLLLGIIHFINFLPVGIYIITVIIIGFISNKHTHAYYIIITMIIFLLSGSYLSNRQIMKWGKEKQLLISIPAVLNIPKSYPFLLIHYTFYERKLTLLAIKIFSIGLLLIVASLGEGTFYLENFMLFFMIIILAHAIMVYKCVQEIEIKMTFFRNLPMPIIERISVYLLVYLIIMSPETIFLLVNFSKDISWWTLIMFYFTGISQLLLFTAVLYLPRINMNRYLQIIFGIFIISEIFLRLPSLYIFFITQTFISILIFSTFYYKYERSN